MRIPVYLFTGFLESGKTTFIQELLEGDDFNAGERTLLLICEEGTTEYRPERYIFPNVFTEVIEKPEDINPRNLGWLQRKHRVERVIVEYNGMWLLSDLMVNLPVEWEVAQEMVFFQAPTVTLFNNNMRQLVYDKLTGADIIVFNRSVRGETSKEELHQLVRGANRSGLILFEYSIGDVEVDDILDPPPYDMDGDPILVKDDEFAYWFRDMNEAPELYEGKNISVKGRGLVDGGLKKNEFVLGRHLMTCCIDDIEFTGFVCKYQGEGELPVNKEAHGKWFTVEGKMKAESHMIYGDELGPVMYVTKVEPAEDANPEVATFS